MSAVTIGQTIVHYRILGTLGAGGMGAVYEAIDERLGRSVALKFVHQELDPELRSIDRLRAEGRTASLLTHPNICTVYDVGEYEGQPFIVMELLKGQTLADRLRGSPLSIAETVDVGIQVAEALDWAHSRGVIHRDIKPANIFLGDRGHVKVLDFGLAKLRQPIAGSALTESISTGLTVKGGVVGTIAYMSPEQIEGEELDGRSDLFSFGAMLYECVTGHQPFPGKTGAAVLAAIMSRAPVPPSTLNDHIPAQLQDAISKCLEKSRRLRYQTASELRTDLRRVQRDLEFQERGSAPVVFDDSSQATPRTPIATAAAQPANSPVVLRGVRGWTIGLIAVLFAAVLGGVWYMTRATAPDTLPGKLPPAATSTLQAEQSSRVDPGSSQQVRAPVSDGRSTGGGSAPSGGSSAPSGTGRTADTTPAIVPPPSATIDGEPWLSAREYTALSQARLKQGYVPARVEGHVANNRDEYRAEWRRSSPSCVVRSFIDQRAEQFKQHDAESQANGLSLFMMMRFTSVSGVARYQGTWTKSCDTGATPADAASPRALGPSDGGQWQSAEDLKTLTEYQDRRGFFAVRIDGRMGAGRREYRADWAQRPAGCAWAYAYGKLVADFRQLDVDNQTKGLAPLRVTQFTDQEGLARYQAMWTRNCSPY